MQKEASRKRSAPAEYQRIETDLRRRIQVKHWPAGAMLPGRRDLAREYAVSVMTVERAISPLIADGTLRVDDRRGTFVAGDAEDRPVADKTGPTPTGVSGRGAAAASATSTVGIIASLYQDQNHLEQNNGWVRQIVQSMEHAFSEQGMATLFFNRAEEPGRPLMPLRQALQNVLQEPVDAVAVIAFDVESHVVDDALSVLEGKDLPVVCVLAGELHRPVPHVFYDNRSAGYQAAQHLVRQGHTRISILAPFEATWVTERVEGVRLALNHAGLPPDALRLYGSTHHWVHEEDPEHSGYQAARDAISQGWDLSGGIICVNDGTAFGLLKAAAEVGKQMIQDFALVGFDDHVRARILRLTSLRPPMEAMGHEAARLLLQAMKGDPLRLQGRLRAHVIPRASSSYPEAGYRPAPPDHG